MEFAANHPPSPDPSDGSAVGPQAPTPKRGRSWLALVALLGATAFGVGVGLFVAGGAGAPEAAPTSTVPEQAVGLFDEEPEDGAVEDGGRDKAPEEVPAAPDDEPAAAAEPTAPAVKPAQPIRNVLGAVEATLRLTSWEVTVEQETASLQVTSTSIVIGDTSSSSMVFNGVFSESLDVDGRSYEREGGIWYLKPHPAAIDSEGQDLEELLAGFSDYPVVELRRSNGVAVVEVLCDDVVRDAAAGAGLFLCGSDSTITARIDVATDRLLSVREEGLLELSPGRFEDGFFEVEIESLEGEAPIEAPQSVDTSRAECIAERVGADLDDFDALSLALDPWTTAENSDIYSGCGFRFFPRGSDFRE